MVLLLLALQSAHAACTEGQLVETLDAGFRAYRQVIEDYSQANVDVMAGIARDAQQTLACLPRPPAAETMVKLHQVMGLSFRLEDKGNADRARLAFAAARVIDPRSALPVDIAPGPEEALYNDYYAVPLDPRPTERLPPPRRGTVYLDGVESRDIAANLPSLFQLTDRSGAMDASMTRYHLPGEALPDYPERRPFLAPGLAMTASAAVLGVGIYHVATGFVAYDECFVNDDPDWSECKDPETQDEAWAQYAYHFPLGYSLMGVGGAGLIASGAWALVSRRQLSVGLQVTW